MPSPYRSSAIPRSTSRCGTKGIGHEVPFYSYFTACIAFSLVAYTILPDTREVSLIHRD